MTTLLQISDAHFGTEQPPVVQALLQLARDQAPDLVVMSGDITQRARRSQFKAARAFIDRLKPAALLQSRKSRHSLIQSSSARLCAVLELLAGIWQESGTAIRIGESARDRRQHDAAYKHVDGELSPQQIERVADRLRRAAPSQLRIIVVHQPVLAIRESDVDNLLDGHRQAIPAWAAAGGDIIMGGHIHLPYVRSLQTTFDALPRDIWTVQAGTAVSSPTRRHYQLGELDPLRRSPVATPMHGRTLGLHRDVEPIRAPHEPGVDVRRFHRLACSSPHLPDASRHQNSKQNDEDDSCQLPVNDCANSAQPVRTHIRSLLPPYSPAPRKKLDRRVGRQQRYQNEQCEFCNERCVLKVVRRALLEIKTRRSPTTRMTVAEIARARSATKIFRALLALSSSLIKTNSTTKAATSANAAM